MSGMRTHSLLLGSVAALVLVAGIGAPLPAEACSDASQQLRYVLGASGEELAVLRLDVHRSDVPGAGAGGGMTVRWTGEARVELVTRSGEARVHRTLGPVDLPARTGDYEKAAAPVFRAAMAAARELPRFREARSPRYVRCGERARCGAVALSARGGTLVIRDGARTRRIEAPEDLLAGLLARGRGIEPAAASEAEKQEALEELRIVHVMRYRIGRREHVVVNLGAGGTRHAWPEAERWPGRGCNGLLACPPQPRTLHHGLHLDVIAGW